ncbi:hypothetical protein DRQ32_06855 [bacterium]|nr:MAG: hypothetical protein DRQ32_06855 [bacterium]
MKLTVVGRVLLVTSLFLGFGGCDDDDKNNNLVQPGFDIDLMVSNLEAALDGAVMGYAFSVARDGNHYASRSGGYARHPLDYPLDTTNGIAMSPTMRVNVASVSKVVGAVALMRVLQEKGISPLTPIHNHLPPSWKPLVHADHFDAGSQYKVDFRKLMRMETGIQYPGSSVSPGAMSSNAQMLSALQISADPSRWGAYQNGNYCLIRVLIGEIEFDLDETDVNYAQNCADAYVQFINDKLFNPIGVSNVLGTYLDRYPPMSYESASIVGHTKDTCTGYFGLAASDGTINNSGSGGLRLSSMGIANFLAYFMHAPDQMGVDVDTRDYILDHYLGFTSTPSYDSPAHGSTPYYAKAGAFTAFDGTCVQAGRAHRSCSMVFAETGVEVGLILNSPGSVCNEIRDAYDAAWH